MHRKGTLFGVEIYGNESEACNFGGNEEVEDMSVWFVSWDFSLISHPQGPATLWWQLGNPYAL